MLSYTVDPAGEVLLVQKKKKKGLLWTEIRAIKGCLLKAWRRSEYSFARFAYYLDFYIPSSFNFTFFQTWTMDQCTLVNFVCEMDI